jgi:acetyl-CoA carboxylase beta subunit
MIAPEATRSLTGRELIDIVLDEGSYAPWDAPAVQLIPGGPEYADDLRQARERSGVDESIFTGRGRINGRDVAVLVSEFSFLAGSIGTSAAHRLETAIRRATAERLPLLAAPASGGTRMQEGTAALVQMVSITAAVIDHKAAGLPYLVYLRHPTTGGVYASWGSLGQITVAEPGALIGFLGPKVYRALYDADFPIGVQTAENLAHHGVIDAVVPPRNLAALASRVLAILDAPRVPGLVNRSDPEPSPDLGTLPVWEMIQRSRDPRRKGIRELIPVITEDAVPIFGTGAGESHPGLLMALALLDNIPCVIIGQDRSGQRRSGPLGPGAFRQVRRAVRLAEELKLPIVLVIDTPGAELSPEAEQKGIAGEIARCLADLLTFRAASVSVLLGEGSGGGALALLPADRILATESSWLAPLPPEGASAIMHSGDTSFAASIAQQQRVSARELWRLGIVDRIVSDYESQQAQRRLGQAIADELRTAITEPTTSRNAARSARFRRLSSPPDISDG